jgi:hypothetical protein
MKKEQVNLSDMDYESKIAEAMTGMVGKIYLALIAKVLQLAKTMDYDELRAGKFCMRLHELTGPSIEELKNSITGVSREQIDSVIAEQLRLVVTHVDINSKLQNFAVQYSEFKALRKYKIIPKQDPKNGVHYWEVLIVSQPWTCC